jgi:hypothetical protein
MAIGRVSGPMLFSNLERQGYDLQFDNGLLYLDVNNRKVGVNTNTPLADFHVNGNVRVTSDSRFNGPMTVTDTATVQGLEIADTAGNVQYALPTTEPKDGKFIGYAGSSPGKTAWLTPSQTPIVRKSFNYRINVAVGGTYQFEIDLQAISAIVYNLTVSLPCTIEVHGLPTYSETNPYTFIATTGHLTDDGSVYYSDGTVIQQRQYNIFANLETPPQERFFVRITGLATSGLLELDLLYFSAVVDTTSASQPATFARIFNDLPSSGQQGEIIYVRNNFSTYIWVDTQWRRIYTY